MLNLSLILLFQNKLVQKKQEEKKKELLADDSKQSAVQKNQKIELDVLPSTQNFGYHVFNKKNRALSFETTLNFPPPIGYVLGAGDQIVIDVFGASEWNYTESIETNGQIFLRNVGPIYLNGLTLKEAQIKIKTRLAEVYKEVSRLKEDLKKSNSTVNTLKHEINEVNR